MRLIDADKLKQQIAVWQRIDPYNTLSMAAGAFIGEVDKLPTVDAVPVLRCRECMEYSGVNLSILGMPCGECDKFGHVCGPDEFCSFGRKRQEAEQN